MRLSRALFVFVFALAGCDGGGSGDGGDTTPVDLPDAAPDAMMVECTEGQRRAQGIDGPLNCAGEPEFVEIVDRGRPFHMFTYEASHPMATADLAFPCATSQGDIFEAPDVATEACSVAGVRPWHSVRWRDAESACEAIGWRLCSGEELLRGCEGEAGNAYAFGPSFVPNACNLKAAYQADGADMASEAPTGQFDECVGEDGAYDLNGNLWEWNSERDDMDPEARQYQGVGWQITQGVRADNELVCNRTIDLSGFSAPSFAKATVGFRCCREVP